MASTDLGATRAYYDEFAKGYELHRSPNDPHGYHAMVDELEVDLVRRYHLEMSPPNRESPLFGRRGLMRG